MESKASCSFAGTTAVNIAGNMQGNANPPGLGTAYFFLDLNRIKRDAWRSRRTILQKKRRAQKRFQKKLQVQNPLVQRNVKFMSLEFPVDDHFFYCEDCKKMYETYCPVHGPLDTVEDSRVSRATGTLPAGLKVKTSTIPGAGLGVFAEREFPVRSRFGPYEGEIKKLEHVQQSDYLWMIYSGGGRPSHVIDGENTAVANWMRYVNCARTKEEQNLTAYQYQGQIYYRSLKKILPGTELLVWYGSECARKLGITQSIVPQLKQRHDKNIFCCYLCVLEFSSADLLTSHTERWHPELLIQCNFVSCGSPKHIGLPLESDEFASASLEVKPFTHCDDVTGIQVKTEDLTEDEHDNVAVSVEIHRTEQNSHSRGKEMPGNENSVSLVLPKHASATVQQEFEVDNFHKLQLPKVLVGKVGSSFWKDETDNESVPGDTYLFVCQNNDKDLNSVPHLPEQSKTHITEWKNGSEMLQVSGSENQVHTMSSDPNKFVCEYCGKKFSSKRPLWLHKKSYHKVRPHKCDHCGKTFVFLFQLKNHQIIHTGERPYACEFCGKTFVQVSHLRTHINIHTGRKPYTCEFCGKSFIQAAGLRIHVRRHTGERPYMCEFCGKGCNQLAEFKVHLRRHTEHWKHTCEQCGRRFQTPLQLRIHGTVHSGIKRFKCDICGEEFKTILGLELHAYRLHDTDLSAASADLPFRCQQCGRCFADFQGLNLHSKTHKKVKLDTNYQRGKKQLYRCEYCGKNFRNNQSLSGHVRSHTGERPYHCDICNKSFAYVSNLRTHNRVHSGNKPYKCELCGKVFSQSGNLDVHIKIHAVNWPHVCELCGKFLRSATHLKTHIRIHLETAS